MMKLKGISPIIASVILIAVTMTVAGVLAFWAAQFVRGKVKTFEEQTAERECDFADFDIFSCTYDADKKSVSIILQNLRKVDLKNITAFVIYENDSIIPEEGYYLGELPANSLKNFKFGSESQPVGNDFKEILITTHCSLVRESTKCR